MLRSGPPLAAALLLPAALLLGCPQEPCPTGETRCGGLCFDTLTSALHCGACGQECGLGTCGAGVCTCDAAATECAGMWPRCADLAGDAAHCGACGTSCVESTGATCVSGACACPPTGATLRCGSTATSCCEGTACCGNGCQTKHSNGVGGFFFDCEPLGTYTLEAATAAAHSWSLNGTDSAFLNCNGSCICRQDTSVIPNRSGTWCYAGTDTGKALVNTINAVCLCYPQGNVAGTWN